MLRSTQIKRLKFGGYKVLRSDGSGLGYITHLNRYWEIKLDGANNCGVKVLHDSFDECQRALIVSDIVKEDK